jgi:hypothetical protein
MTTAVIVTACDRPELLPRALESVARQRLPPDEVIVVNDGQAAVTCPGVRHLRVGPNAGPAAARNAGAAASHADNLLFLDDDDEWLPEYAEAAVGLLKHHDIALSGFLKAKRDGTRVPEKVPPTDLVASEWFVRNQGLRGSNLAMRKSAFAAVGGFDELLWCGEDMDLAIRCADRGLRYAVEPRHLVVYHAHSGPRITARDVRHRQAHRTFLAAHGGRMTDDMVQAFRERTQALFGVDPGPVPTLVWVLGPPGAGKTTWATRRAQPGDRVMDLGEIMPWLDGADFGVRTAKRHIAAAIRAVEERRPVGERRLFVTPAYLDRDDLGLLLDFEHVVAVVPPAERWRAQLFGREGRVDPKHETEHARWVARYGTNAHANLMMGEPT